ncbi:MAG: transposase [Merdibacter sp.]
MEPVVLFKMLIINIVFGINSMRKTCQEIPVNLAYRWFLGLDIRGKGP